MSSSLSRALQSAHAENGVLVRSNEARCEVRVGAIDALADLVCGTLGAELIAILGEDRRTGSGAMFVHYVFAHHGEHWLLHAAARLDPAKPEVPSLAPFCYPASRFEREMQDLLGIRVAGHPDPRPLVKHGFWPAESYPLRKDSLTGDFTDDGQPFPFTEVAGEGVYEIPVGPVHAGVIEPGHFRFSVMGETIIDMKSRLYFTHKGTEKLFEGRRPEEGVPLAERVSGDTSVGHALAFCRALESAASTEVPERAALLRVVLLELERIYNHVGDFGAIANDTGFAVAQSHCLRIRERLLRLNKQLTGSRLLRGVIAPGGLARDVDVPRAFVADIDSAIADFNEVVAICLTNTLVRDRLEGTGVLSTELANDYGVVGYIGRASGRALDARRDHPCAGYAQLGVRVATRTTGDVHARTMVRVDEVRESARLIREALNRLHDGAAQTVRCGLGRIEPFTPAVAVVEGWRGRIVHWVMVAADGALHRVKIVDPSFLNWPALSRALVGNIVPDFPLCNKSFNQSYSGNDL